MVPPSSRSIPAQAGWAGDVFTLGPLKVDRTARRAWFAAQEVQLPTGGLFDILTTFCEGWSDVDQRCAPVPQGQLVRLANGKARRLGYDDVNRLRSHFPTRDIIETVSGVGYRLVVVTWPPTPRVRNGLQRARRRPPRS